MKTMIVSALALFIAMPAIASAAEADVIITTHHRHHHKNVKIINDQGQRLHYRKHGTVAFYDHGRRHHRPDTVIVTGSIEPRHHWYHRYHRHHRVVIQEDSDY